MPDADPVTVPAAPAERGHHPDSPSSLQSSEACALFLNEQRETRAATSGTLCHKACEAEDPSLCDTEQESEAVRKCLDYAKRVGETKSAEEGEIICIKEKYLGVGDEKVGEYIGITGGFPDLVYVAKLFADVLDWKYGADPVVPTKDNLQGISYALGIFKDYATVQKVSVHFYAPNQGWSEAEHNAKYVYTFLRSECEELELRVRTVVARKKAANKRLAEKGTWVDATPKTSLCIWCARKGDCTKCHAVVLRGAEKYPDFVVPQELNPLALTKAEQVATAFRWASQVEMIAKAVKARCSTIALTESLDLGPTLKVAKRTEREIKSFNELVNGAQRAGATMEELTPLFSVPFTKVEDLIKKKAAKGKGAEAIRALQADWEQNGATQMGLTSYFLKEVKTPKDKNNPIIEIEP